MLYGEMAYKDLVLLLQEALRYNQGDIVEIDRDLAEQLVSSMQTLVALHDVAAKTDNRSSQHHNQLDLF